MPKPTIELYNESCLDVLDRFIEEGRTVDCIVTDPPYRVISGGNKNTNAPKGCLKANDGKIFKFNDLPEEEWFPKIYEVLRDPGHAYIMINTLNLERYLTLARKAGFKLHNLLIWEKNNVLPNRFYMKNVEYILFLRKGKAFSINNKGSKTCHKFTNLQGRDHPSEKPVPLMEFYISNSSQEGETVLDFTMGSGSVGRACQNLNRNFIGIELDPEYYALAQRNLGVLDSDEGQLKSDKPKEDNSSDLLF